MRPLVKQDTGSGYIFNSTGSAAAVLGLPLTYEKTGETNGGYTVFRAKEKESALYVDSSGYWETSQDIGPFSVAAYNTVWPTPDHPPEYGWVFSNNNGWEEDPTLHMIPYGHG